MFANHATFPLGSCKHRRRPETAGGCISQAEGVERGRALKFQLRYIMMGSRRHERIVADWLAGNEIGKATKFET